MGSWYRVEPDALVIALRVSPKASRSAIIGVMQTEREEALKVAVTVPPDNGRANEAVISLIAKTFSVAKRDATLISGATDRRKVVRVSGDPSRLAACAAQWSSP